MLLEVNDVTITEFFAVGVVVLLRYSRLGLPFFERAVDVAACCLFPLPLLMMGTGVLTAHDRSDEGHPHLLQTQGRDPLDHYRRYELVVGSDNDDVRRLVCTPRLDRAKCSSVWLTSRVFCARCRCRSALQR